jgi:hypothetical protein
MPIRFPDFRETRCVAVGACGALDTDEQEVLSAVEELQDEVLIASYRMGNATAYIRVHLGGTTPKHVHIDVYKREAFGNKIPKTTHKRKDIEKILNQFTGKKITTSAFGRFILPVAELPEAGLIRSTFFGTKQGDLSIEVSGANLTIKGAPIRNLTWQFAEKGTSVRIDIHARVEKVINDNYLIDQLHLLDFGFRLFVLGKGEDGAH